jgi:hypothetical protein
MRLVTRFAVSFACLPGVLLITVGPSVADNRADYEGLAAFVIGATDETLNKPIAATPSTPPNARLPTLGYAWSASNNGRKGNNGESGVIGPYYKEFAKCLYPTDQSKWVDNPCACRKVADLATLVKFGIRHGLTSLD